MNIGPTPKGTKTGLQQSFAQQAWALAISSDFVLGEVQRQLEQKLGSLPPPVGMAPVLISDELACVLPNPFGGCLQTAQQTVTLDSLSLSLLSGLIRFTGQLTQKTAVWWIPDITATFTVDSTLAMDAAQEIYVQTSQPSVQLQQWYAQLLNTLSLNALANAVQDGIGAAFQSAGQQAAFSALFSPSTLSSLAAVGSTGVISVAPTASSVEVRPDALIVHGVLGIGQRSLAPTADLVALAGPASPTRRLLHAGESWAPGGTVVSFDFDFGDGQGRATSGIGAQFVADHDYAPGTYKACVTVRDDAGRSATSCQWMHPGVLVLHHGREKSAGVELPEWETCQDKQAGSPRSATFFVSCETAPLAGATVTVSTAQWQDAAVTDANGSVKFSIPENRFVPAPAGLHGSFAIGAVAVEASKPGYRSDTRSLWLMDCEGRAEIAGKVAEAKRKFAQWLERYQIIEFDISILKGKPTNPRASDELLDIGATLDTLDTLVRTVGRGATTLPIRQLLGIEGDVRAGLGIISRRFDTVLESIDEVLGQMSRELDGDIRGGGQVGDSEVRERRPPLGVDLPGTGEF